VSIRILTDDELERVFERTRAHVCGPAIRLMAATGVRVSEVVLVRAGDIDAGRCELRLRDRYGIPGRVVSIPEELRDVLVRRTGGLKEDEFIFSHPGDAGRPLVRRTVQKLLSETGRELGIQGVTVTNLRATRAVRWLEAGTDPRRIRESMGFRKPRSLERYAALTGGVRIAGGTS